MELDQSSELYKTIVAAIIKEEEDGDVEEDDGDIEEDAFEELDAGTKADSQATGSVVKRFVKIVASDSKQTTCFYQGKWCCCSKG